MRKRLFIIHNPHAGSLARRHYRATLALLSRCGVCIEIVEGAHHGESIRAASDAALSGGFDAIVAAGGDGTVRDVAEGLIGRPIPLGIIPMGTGNVFAREIGLPFTPDRLARTLLRGDVRAIPVGQVNGRLFLFVIGVGFDAEAVRYFEAAGNRELGRAAFVWPVLRALAAERDQTLRVRTDRGEAEAQWVIVTRARYYAGNLMLCPQADVQKAQFYVVRFAGSGPLNRLRQLVALSVGLLRYDLGVDIQPAAWVRIDSDFVMPVQIDGDVLGDLPLEISVHPQRLQLILPRW